MNALKAIDSWWMAPAPARRLATVRLLVGAYALVHLLARLPHLVSFAKLEPQYFQPIGVVGLVLSSPLSSVAHYGVVTLTVLLSVAFVLGWRHHVTGPLFGVALLWLLTYVNCFGFILHTTNALALYVLVLGITPSADALSLDARRRADEQAGSTSSRYGWPLMLMVALCVSVYVLAGVAKFKVSGFAFFEGEALRNHIAFDNVRKIELGSYYSPLGVLVLPYSTLFVVTGALTMVLELGAPLALLHRKVGAVWAVMMWGFHVGVLALMMIVFPVQLTGVAFAPFFRVERLLNTRPGRWVERRFTMPTEPSHESR